MALCRSQSIPNQDPENAQSVSSTVQEQLPLRRSDFRLPDKSVVVSMLASSST